MGLGMGQLNGQGRCEAQRRDHRPRIHQIRIWEDLELC